MSQSGNPVCALQHTPAPIISEGHGSRHRHEGQQARRNPERAQAYGSIAGTSDGRPAPTLTMEGGVSKECRKLVSRAEERLARGIAAVSAARERATEIAQQSAAQPDCALPRYTDAALSG